MGASPEILSRRPINLAEHTEATSERTEPSDRMAKARAAKKQRATITSSDDIAALLAAFKTQQEQIDSLKAALAEKREDHDGKTLLDPVPAPSEDLRPGTYVKVGTDTAGKDIMGKVRWTREWIAKTYPTVTFTPNRGMVVAPHGISYTLVAEAEATVPSIVKDTYDSVIRQEREHAARYRAMSAAEQADVDARANAEPGTKQWSRVTRVGFGLAIPEVADSVPDAPAV